MSCFQINFTVLLSVLFFYKKLSPGNFLNCLRVFILTKYLNTAYIPSEIILTKKFEQKVYRKIVQIKNSYGNEYTYKKCTSNSYIKNVQTVQTCIKYKLKRA